MLPTMITSMSLLAVSSSRATEPWMKASRIFPPTGQQRLAQDVGDAEGLEHHRPEFLEDRRLRIGAVVHLSRAFLAQNQAGVGQILEFALDMPGAHADGGNDFPQVHRLAGIAEQRRENVMAPLAEERRAEILLCVRFVDRGHHVPKLGTSVPESGTGAQTPCMAQESGYYTPYRPYSGVPPLAMTMDGFRP